MGNRISVLRKSNPVRTVQGPVFRYEFHGMDADQDRVFRQSRPYPSQKPWEDMISKSLKQPAVVGIHVYVTRPAIDGDVLGQPVYRIEWDETGPRFTVIDEYTDLASKARTAGTGVHFAGYILPNRGRQKFVLAADNTRLHWLRTRLWRAVQDACCVDLNAYDLGLDSTGQKDCLQRLESVSAHAYDLASLAQDQGTIEQVDATRIRRLCRSIDEAIADSKKNQKARE